MTLILQIIATIAIWELLKWVVRLVDPYDDTDENFDPDEPPEARK